MSHDSTTALDAVTREQGEVGAVTREHGGPDILCEDLVRIYSTEGVEVQALQGLNLRVEPGDVVALVGASGSGKSTLLNILSGLDKPTGGTAVVAGVDLLSMNRRQRVTYQRHVVGFVWQQTSRNLLPFLTAAENIALPLVVSSKRHRADRVEELLELLDITDVRDRRPAEMSGGQQQRVAVATALANTPSVLLADEPTGELDEAMSAEVLDAMRDASERLGVTVLIVTHDPTISDHVRRTVQIRDGRTSTEVLRHVEVDEHGNERLVTQEFTVIDRAGRMQLPTGYVVELGLRDRVRLELEADHVGVWPDRRAGTRPGTGSLATEAPRATQRSHAMTDRAPYLLRGEGLSRTFGRGAAEVHALVDVDIEVRPAELTVVRGPSGSGKTTLLNVLGGLDRPTSGRVLLGDGRVLSELPEADVLEARRQMIGYIFQSFGLVPVLSAAENVEVPLRLLGTPVRERNQRVQEVLDLVGLGKHGRQRPYELSGGQQQRVGIARALVARPQILIADEPTGQLDSDTATTIMDLLADLTHQQGIAAVVSTHDPILMARTDRLVDLHDGRVVSGVDWSRPPLGQR